MLYLYDKAEVLDGSNQPYVLLKTENAFGEVRFVVRHSVFSDSARHFESEIGARAYYKSLKPPK